MSKCLKVEYLLVLLAMLLTKCKKRYLKKLRQLKSNNENNPEEWFKICYLNKMLHLLNKNKMKTVQLFLRSNYLKILTLTY